MVVASLVADETASSGGEGDRAILAGEGDTVVEVGVAEGLSVSTDGHEQLEGSSFGLDDGKAGFAVLQEYFAAAVRV